MALVTALCYIHHAHLAIKDFAKLTEASRLQRGHVAQVNAIRHAFASRAAGDC